MSVNSPAKRDLVEELAEACRRKKLGLFLYCTYALDWKHPYFYSREAGWTNARPAYDDPEPTYKFEKDADFQHYIDFVHAQLRELLTQYGPLAGIWLDPIMGYYSRPDLFPIDETYALIGPYNPSALFRSNKARTATKISLRRNVKRAAWRKGATWQRACGKSTKTNQKRSATRCNPAPGVMTNEPMANTARQMM